MTFDRTDELELYRDSVRKFLDRECPAETARDIVLACQQYVMGAYGYAEGFQMERYVRDVLAVPIYGGSSAIQKNNIATLMKLPRE